MARAERRRRSAREVARAHARAPRGPGEPAAGRAPLDGADRRENEHDARGRRGSAQARRRFLENPAREGQMATEARQETHGGPGASPDAGVTNWFGDLSWEASVLVDARSVEDIFATMRDTDKHPSPVRGRGSGHSTTLCGIADGGTVVDVSRMDR